MVDRRNGGGEAASLTAESPSNTEPAQTQDHAQSSNVTPNATAEDIPSSKPPSKASSRRNSTQGTSNGDLRQPTHTSNGTPSTVEQPPQSQPMTATNSASSHDTAKESKESKEPVVASYGTRSRNRPGRSRPNYAEDVEMDFEMAPAATNGNVSEPPSRASVATENSQPSGTSAKKGLGPTQGNAPLGNGTVNAKDQPPNQNIPGTSSFAANPGVASAQPPKRRKNAASHATSGNHANAAAPSQVGARRANGAMPAVNAAREMNMMTFETTGALLQDNRLEADDGRTVSINGKFEAIVAFASVMGLASPATSASHHVVSDWPCRSSLPRVRAARRALLHMPHHGVAARQRGPPSPR